MSRIVNGLSSIFEVGLLKSGSLSSSNNLTIMEWTEPLTTRFRWEVLL